MQVDRVSHEEAPESGEESELESRFFSAPPASLAPREIETSGSFGPPPMPRSNQLVMVATVAMIATAAMVIPLTLIYSKSLVGAGSMLSHEGPFLPDQAAYRASRTQTTKVLQTDVIASTSNGEAEPVSTTQTATVEEPAPAAGTVQASPSGGGPMTPLRSADGTAPLGPHAGETGDGETMEPAASSPVISALAATPAEATSTTPDEHGGQAIETASAPKKAARRSRRGPRTGSVEHAFELFNAGKFQAAERAARRAANAYPTRADAWLILGAARDALGNRRGAVAAYNVCSARALGPAAMDCQRLARGD